MRKTAAVLLLACLPLAACSGAGLGGVTDAIFAIFDQAPKDDQIRWNEVEFTGALSVADFASVDTDGSGGWSRGEVSVAAARLVVDALLDWLAGQAQAQRESGQG